MNYMRRQAGRGEQGRVSGYYGVRVGCPGRVSGKFSQVGKEYVSPAKVII